MKLACSVLALVLALGLSFSASASDRKIGNIIAVERTIDNVYQNCMDQLASDEAPSSIYTCKFDVKNTNADFAPGTQNLLSSPQNCEVEAVLQNSIILVIFNANGPKADLAGAKSCLRRALDASANKDSFKFMVYTVE